MLATYYHNVGMMAGLLSAAIIFVWLWAYAIRKTGVIGLFFLVLPCLLLALFCGLVTGLLWPLFFIGVPLALRDARQRAEWRIYRSGQHAR